jgi:hypothetical protein
MVNFIIINCHQNTKVHLKFRNNDILFLHPGYPVPLGQEKPDAFYNLSDKANER